MMRVEHKTPSVVRMATKVFCFASSITQICKPPANRRKHTTLMKNSGLIKLVLTSSKETNGANQC